jgi:heat shock protein HslJ
MLAIVASTLLILLPLAAGLRPTTTYAQAETGAAGDWTTDATPSTAIPIDLAASVHSATDLAQGTLVGPVWRWWETVFNDDTHFVPEDRNKYTLTFTADGTVHVQADCNVGNGPYTVDENQISIQILAMTQAYCGPTSLSDTFVQQLGRVSSYFTRGGELIMEFPVDSGSMRFATPFHAGGGEAMEGGTTDIALLERTPWMLVQYAGPAGSIQSVIPDTEIVATFQAGRLFGSAGCNNYTGSVEVSGSAISIPAPATTLRLCTAPPGIMEQEAAYLAALPRSVRITVAPDALTLYGGDGAVLLRYRPQPQTPLEGTAWVAEAYNNGRDAVVSLITGTEITARFEGGRVAGSAGCNTYTASYTLNGNTIAIGSAASTRMFCSAPAGVMEQEGAYLAALPTARIYRIEGRRLILETADGARVASFTTAAQATAPDPSPGAALDATAKINFDLGTIHDTGLTGPPDGLVAVAYEFCIPATPEHLPEVQRIDPTVQAQPGAPGRIGCGAGELLCIGSTHQPNWRSVLQELAALDYVTRIDRFFAE